MTLDDWQIRWREAWPEALSLWSPWLRLSNPIFVNQSQQAGELGVEGVLACFGIEDKSVKVNLPLLEKQGLIEFPLEVLAHEIGHHVLAPGNLLDHFKILATVRMALPTLEAQSPWVANLWTDLVVNDRLQRTSDLDLAQLYRKMEPSDSQVWALYLRIYERLWDLPQGSLAKIPDTVENRDVFEADAWLGSRTVRVYRDDPVTGSGRFACLLFPWLVRDKETSQANAQLWLDAKSAATGASIPAGIGSLDPQQPIHPSRDFRVCPSEEAGDGIPKASAPPIGGQTLVPWEIGELLRLGGLNVSDAEVAASWYREKALQHLVHPPSRKMPTSPDPLPEGLDPWEMGDPLERLDIFQSLLRSPRLVPGITTVARHWGEQPSSVEHLEPIDLDLYVDSSGSMPDPVRTVSHLALAGAIVALSALRRGAGVQVTLWSGKGQCLRTPGFVRDERDILSVLCSHFGGSTTFPLHALRKTWLETPHRRRAHILHISDDGLSTLFDPDERGTSGETLAANSLEAAGGGGTMALQLGAWALAHQETTSFLAKARDQGWAIHPISDWESLMDFAREFSRAQVRDAKVVK
ncbi:MAG: VWA domain-containing protein [Fibrobacterota bacterium]|nr:VWA domain-containing protein [Fibrobacterota bacterium]QQS07096.1 MAG: VWA domain-containing protein [Fibrobacterota bacterium]